VTLFLVRHAKAGSRDKWDGADEERPLSKNGWKQADAISKRLQKHNITMLLSSPFVRCSQTLEPLARALDLEVIPDARLAEGERVEDVLTMLAELPDGSVLCTHGDIVPETIAALQRRGCVIDSDPDWRKGTVWKLERSADTVTRATVTPPPG
jgi:8-oxo-dGTP diphosphatase